jgi:hypothetical protein
MQLTLMLPSYKKSKYFKLKLLIVVIDVVTVIVDVTVDVTVDVLVVIETY